MSWLERAICVVSPKYAYGRMAWRNAVRGYDAGGHGRLNDGWNATNQPGSATDRMDRDIIRARARDLERNSPIAESVVKAFVRNVVGSGFTLQARVTDADSNADEQMNTDIERLWRDWCKPRNCDITGRQSFNEICRMIMRRKLIDGGIFIIKTYSAGGMVPFKLQLREVDELDTTYQAAQRKNGNYVVDGIEINSFGKHVAYYFRTFSPDGYSQIDSERVEAERVIYVQKFSRPSQVREMSPMSVSIPIIRDTNQYMEAVTVQARIAACLAMIVKRLLPGSFGRGSAVNKTDAESGYQGQTITPGMFYYMQPGEDVDTVQPPSIGSSAKELIAIQQRLAGSGLGLSYEVTSRDMSQSNYSSARQGLIEDNQEYEIEQQYFLDHILSEIYTTLLISLALSNMLPFDANKLIADKARYMAHEFIAKGKQWIDPLKEAKANQVALESGQTTLAKICAEAGLDWRENVKQRGLELEAMKAAGIIDGGDANAA